MAATNHFACTGSASRPPQASTVPQLLAELEALVRSNREQVARKIEVIAQLRAQGATLKAIGDAAGISDIAVGQQLDRAGYDRTTGLPRPRIEI